MQDKVGTPPPPYHMQPNVSPIRHVGACRCTKYIHNADEIFPDFKTSYSMQWIIDLLIDKLKKEKEEEWSPIPLWIEDDIEYPDREEDDQKDDQKVIVIDL